MKVLYVVVNVIIFLAVAPLFEGIIRKLTAKIQSRQGPPIVQPYYDLLKLLGKENLIADGNASFRVAPVVAFASIVAAIAFLPFGGKSGILDRYADIITVIYLLTLGGVSVLLGALSSKNTFAAIGASREMITMIMVEPVLAMTFIMGAIKIQSLGVSSAIRGITADGFGWSVLVMCATYLFALQAFVARQPFDIAEAEIEILEGPFIEYSGPNYALFKYYMMLKQMFYASLLIMAFAPFVLTEYYAVNVIIQLIGVAGVYVLIALLGATNPRLRIDQAITYYSVLIVLALCAVGLSVYGL
ncbi:MAG: NADH-quinone oxidoreductase subunit H [Spirochaetes bacterium]|nr:NADH-quinone oxidoreductase subunit H [Spirochaetota bacterium]